MKIQFSDRSLSSKAIFFLFSCYLFLASEISVSSDEIDDLIGEQKFSAALEKIQSKIQTLKKSNDELKWGSAVTKEAQLLMSLHGYETAVKTLRTHQWPEKPLASTMVNLIYAHTLKTYLQSYSWEIRERSRSTAEISSLDLKAWTTEQISTEAMKAFEKTWVKRDFLGRHLKTSLSEVIDSNTYPKGIRDTLRDSVSYIFADFLSDTSLWSAAQANEVYTVSHEKIIQGEASIDLSNPETHPLRKIGFILNDLSRWHSSRGEKEAALEARIALLKHLHQHLDNKTTRQEIQNSLASLAKKFQSTAWATTAYAALAEMIQQEDKPDAKIRALEIAQKGASLFKKSPGAAKCRDIMAEIERPSFSIDAMNVDGPFKKSIAVNYQNLERLSFKSYSVSYRDFIQTTKDYSLRLNWRDLEPLLKKSPSHSWEARLPKARNYASHQHFITPPEHTPGFYIVTATADKIRQLQGVQIFFSDLVMSVHRDHRSSDFEVEIASGKNGEPIHDVELLVYRADYQKGHQLLSTKKTDKTGFATFDLREQIEKSGHHGIFVVAQKDNEITASRSPFYLQASPPPEPPRLNSFVYSDRSVYRPGQKIQWKAVLYEGSTNTKNFAVKPQSEVTVILNDSNGAVIQKKKVKTNLFGTASGTFIIPEGRLLGTWGLSTSYGGYASVRVEEYKRPTFELQLLRDQLSLKLNQKASIKGQARYYFGQPLSQGKVVWSIERTPILPWWCFWGRWSWNSYETPQQIASGASALQPDGTFNIDFVPAADERLAQDIPDITYNYKLSADVTDEAGETRSIAENLMIGFSSINANLELDKNFYLTSSKPKVTVSRSSLNGNPIPGPGAWKLMRLVQPDKTLSPADLPPPKELTELAEDNYSLPDDLRQPRWITNVNPAQLMRDWNVGELISSGTLTPEEMTFELPELPTGAYRLSYETADSAGNKEKVDKDFLVADHSTSFNLPGFFSLEKNSVEVGDKIRLLHFSGFKSQRMTLEWYQDAKLKKRIFLTSGSSSITEIPVKEADRGAMSFTLRILYDHQEMRFEQSAIIPWSNKDLNIEFSSFRDKLTPGTKERWSLKVLSPTKKGSLDKAVEILAYMYDRSLDVFSPHSPPEPKSFFPTITYSRYPQSELGQADHVYSPYFHDSRNNESSDFKNDVIKFFSSYGIGGPGVRGGRGQYMFSKAAMAGAKVMSDSSLESAESAEERQIKKKGTQSENKPESNLRSNFQETAFWLPHLKTDKSGTAIIDFDVPDSVTSWSFWVHALAKDLSSGMVQKEVRTAKDLMIKPKLPRFFREGDEVDLKILISNTTNKLNEGQLHLEIYNPESKKNLNSTFGQKKGEQVQGFKVPANSSITSSFKLHIPFTPGTVAVRVIAKSGGLSDGELHPITILPGRFHLTQSKFVTLKGNDVKDIDFPEFKTGDDKDLVNNLISVNIDAQLMNSALASIPYIIDDPCKSTEQALNSFLTTGILTSLFETSPQYKQLAKELSKRKSAFLGWGSPDVNLQLQLEETPWILSSKGGGEAASNILAPNKALKVKEDSLIKLERSQTALGGFPWFTGGAPSPYITLSILHGLSRAMEFGISVPKPMVLKSWAYLHRYYLDEIVKHARGLDCCSEFVTFLSYVLSQYPDESWTGGLFKENDKKALLDHSFKNWKSHSPFMKSYLTMALIKSKRHEDAKVVWESVMDSAKTTEDEGTHWAQEDRSWLWYNDTIGTHAMALRVGKELGTSKEKLDGLVQWIFLNKKLNQWKSSRASAEVIYSLAHYLRKNEQKNEIEKFSILLDKSEQKLTFSPENPINKRQIFVVNEKITPTLLPIKIKKSGPGLAFASVTWNYSTEKLPSEAKGDFFQVERKYFKRSRDKKGLTLQPITSGVLIELGDEIEVQLSLKTKHPTEYVHLKDTRASGFEPVDLISTHKSQSGISWYEEIKDSATNFYIEDLPQGEFTLRYTLRVSLGGKFKVSPAKIQSLYAPEFNAFSSGETLNIQTAKD